MTIQACAFSTSLGWLILGESGKGLCFLRFFGPEEPSRSEVIGAATEEYPNVSVDPDSRSELLERAKNCLLAYIDQGLPIPDLPIDLPNWRGMPEIRARPVRPAGHAAGTRCRFSSHVTGWSAREEHSAASRAGSI